MSDLVVDVAGVARLRAGVRLRAEADRLAEMLVRAVPPASCGPAIPVAPARGGMAAFQPREMVLTDAGNLVSRRAGYLGRDAARVADAFDRMTSAAERAHAGRGKAAGAFVPPFTHGQVSAARDYAALDERCEASGLSCVSLETRTSGGGSGGNGGREEAVFADFARRRALQRRVGVGLAKEVRRLRPSSTGGKRRAIYVRRLVDMVCLGDATISDVLVAHGWGKNARECKALQAALCGALDRMQGFDLDRAQNMG